MDQLILGCSFCLVNCFAVSKRKECVGNTDLISGSKIYIRYVYSRKSRRDQRSYFSIGRTMFCDVAEGPLTDFRRFSGDVAISKLVRDYGYFGDVFRFILSVARSFIVRSHR